MARIMGYALVLLLVFFLICLTWTDEVACGIQRAKHVVNSYPVAAEFAYCFGK